MQLLGLSVFFSWMRHHAVLSEAQCARVDLCRNLIGLSFTLLSLSKKKVPATVEDCEVHEEVHVNPGGVCDF